MIILTHVDQLINYLSYLKTFNRSIGFTPTMGALHKGHLSLIRRSMDENDVSIVSIYVNPTQFNDKKDLKRYPRPIQNDIKLLRSVENHILFMPLDEEIYPDGVYIAPEFDRGGLDEKMEGAFRPGHFDGVIKVVHRLLDIVKPDSLYMGQKDLQQFTLIDRMIDQLKMPIDLIVCEISREESGLARSSRNERLSPNARDDAARIQRALSEAKELLRNKSLAEALQIGRERLDRDPFKLEYLIAVNMTTLDKVGDLDQASAIAICAALWIDGIRLIDNVIIKN